MKKCFRVFSIGMLCILTASVSFAQIGIFEANVDVDNGQLGAEGSASYDAATDMYTINGSGADVWNNTGSNFHFVYREWTGDFDLRADVTIGGGLETQDWVKSMLYCAEGLEGESNYITTRVRRDGQFSSQWRAGGAGSDGSTPGDLRVSGLNPARQRLVRIGNTFSTYYMNETGEWALIDSNEVELAETVLVGMGVCSHDLGELATGTFSKVALGAPVDAMFDMSIDIDSGNLGEAGSSAYDAASDTYTLTGSGDDIWGSADNCQFLYKEISGDFVIEGTIKADAGTSTSDWVKAGLMARENLDPGSAHADIIRRPDGLVNTQWRLDAGADSDSAEDALRATIADEDIQMKLVRSGDTFMGYYKKASDADFTFQIEIDVIMTDPILVGMAVTAHETGSVSSGQFIGVTISGGASAAENWELLK
jgi:regulation of enolase protein 1 (concanavalin A-like superfamily)